MLASRCQRRAPTWKFAEWHCNMRSRTLSGNGQHNQPRHSHGRNERMTVNGCSANRSYSTDTVVHDELPQRICT